MGGSGMYTLLTYHPWYRDDVLKKRNESEKHFCPLQNFLLTIPHNFLQEPSAEGINHSHPPHYPHFTHKEIKGQGNEELW